MTTKADVGRRLGPVKQLCDSIGQSENLFSTFANYCVVKAAEEWQPAWGSVIRDVLMGMQDNGEKVTCNYC
jgi:hypothetical protein